MFFRQVNFRRVKKSSSRALVTLLMLCALVSMILAQSAADTQDKTRTQSTNDPQQQKTPPQKPKPGDDEVQISDDVIRTETNLTTIFFTAEDKHRRYISTLKQDDIRITEDGQPQHVFTFQTNTDLPLSLAVLIDTSRSEERTLPEEKSASREFLETVL